MKNKSHIRYELILGWSTPKRPFKLQKLLFPASPVFHLAYKEAKAIKNMLQRSGDLKKSEVKLLAVSVAGVLADLQKEDGVYFRKHAAEMKAIAKNAKEMQSKPAKRAMKAKPSKDADLKWSIETNKKPAKLSKNSQMKSKLKTKVMPPPEPMINAVKSKNKRISPNRRAKSKK